MTSHKKKSKSIWASTNKYHIPTEPAVIPPKPFVVWEKSIYGHTAVCKTCQKHYHALSKTQKHLVSSVDGTCFHCRDVNKSSNTPTIVERELKGTPSFPEVSYILLMLFLMLE
jgi:hypothetical protein